MGTRRNPRRAAAKTGSMLESLPDEKDDDKSIESSSDNPASSSEEELLDSESDDSMVAKLRKPSATPKRSSSRTNKFSSSMKEPGVNDVGYSSNEEDHTPASPRHKSPAKSHSSERRRVRLDDTEEESSEEEEEDSEDEEEPFAIKRILACRSEKLSVWKEICASMQTSEIEFGSRWFQDDSKEEDQEQFQERFLVQWADLGFLHCSWETRQDLVEQTDTKHKRTSVYMTTFFKKATNGILFTADERNDGDYFDPAFTQIERILQVHEPEDEDGKPLPCRKNFGIIMDRNDPNFESGTGRQFLIKWRSLPYSEITFEFERDLILNNVEYLDHITQFEERTKKPSKKQVQKEDRLGDAEDKRAYKLFGDNSPISEEDKERKVKAYQDELAEHVFPNGGQLRDYQAEGVTWLLANYVNERSCILIDEMGLGKTLQTAAFINLVAKRFHRRGPFLIVAPLSTIAHWYREFTTWTDLNTIVYHGSQEDRVLIREHEMAYECDRPASVGMNQQYLRKCMSKLKSRFDKVWMAQVVITTPESLVCADFGELTAVPWEVLVVDEAHRLKNHNSKLMTNLRDSRFDFGHTLLLTGTPIQNNMSELWALMNFIDPDNFDVLDEFLDKYGNIKSKEGIDDLHEMLRPYILRRLKEDVEKSVPPKEETLIEVELTVLQKKYYRALYEKNVAFLNKGRARASDSISLNNLAMQLRKCCNHPFLLAGVEEEVRQDEKSLSEGDFLVKASGKLVLLDKLLPRLKENGHRVLLFSQFKIMLDILEDYLNARKFKFERIDGSITGKMRQMAIDRFQAPSTEEKESPLVMLLSTRAGGVGINLTAADTCIIFDSDWNPQNDLQAQARCHRIGQTKDVKVYRLLTRKTYEMQMFHMSSLKMGLDQAVLQGFESGAASGEAALTKEEVEKLLRHGAYDMFNEEKAGTAEAESNAFVEQDIDSILARCSKTVVHEQTGSNSNAAGGTFSKASFKAPKTPAEGAKAANDEDIDVDDPAFWTKMLGEPKETERNTNILTTKKRRRNKANYAEDPYGKEIDRRFRMDDSEGDDSDSDKDDDSSSSDDGSDDWSPGGRPEESSPELESVEPVGTATDVLKELQSVQHDGTAPQPLKASAKKRRAKKPKKEKARWGGTGSNDWDKSDSDSVLKSLQMYGYGNFPWATFMGKAGIGQGRYSVEEVKRLCWSILLLTLREVAEDDSLLAMKKAERDAEKKRAAAEGDSPSNKSAQAAGRQDAIIVQHDPEGQLESSFKKFVKANAYWLKQVLVDVNAFAEAHPARTKRALNRAMRPYVPDSSAAGLEVAFAQNIWPSLRSRGWTAEPVTDGKNQGMTCYSVRVRDEDDSKVYKYYSPLSVIHAATRFHPELSKTCESLLKTMPSEETEKEGGISADEVTSLSIESISASSVSSFLEKYAPLQLLVDRVNGKKLSLNRKMLVACSSMSAAHTLVERALESPGSDSVTDKVARLLSQSKRVALPHPSWTSRHDAVLIEAIAKHGWIEYDSCCLAITDDSSIKWGAPFDSVDTNTREAAEADAAKNGTDTTALRETAARAATFLNVEHDMVESLKGFNQDVIVTAYGLVKSNEETNPDSSNWVVGTDLAQPKSADAQGSDTDSDSGSYPEVDLPTKKELRKRAKHVLSNTSLLSAVGAEAAVAGTAVSSDHGFTVVDRSDPCNWLLVELLRGLLKTSFQGRKEKVHFAKKVAAHAREEAKNRRDYCKNRNLADDVESNEADTQAKDYQNIADHIRLVERHMSSNSRLANNVLKAMLGLEPIPPKNPAEPMFPRITNELDISLVGKPTSSAADKVSGGGKKRAKDERPFGDRAIGRAISRVTAERKGSGFSAGSVDSLELSEIESLLLSTMCSQGLPVWTENWLDVTEETQAQPDVHGPSPDKIISWHGMGEVLQSVAENWHYQTLIRLGDKRIQLAAASDKDKEKCQAEVAVLEMEESFKRAAFAAAKDFHAHPLKLAKKCVMLLEALRTRMGQVETKKGGTLKKMKIMSKSENCLGPLCLGWMNQELSRWGESLGIADPQMHRPPNYTAANFYDTTTDNGCVGVAAIIDKKDCRAIFGQIAQLSRARAVFLKHDKKDTRDLVSKATHNSSSLDGDWKEQPTWWDPSIHDYDLLDGLLEFGYGPLNSIFSERESFVNAIEANSESIPTRVSLQIRANQLTRELHALEDTADVMRIVSEMRAGSHSNRSSPASISSEGDTAKKKAASLQPGIEAFFSSKSPSQSEDSEIEVVEAPSSGSERKPSSQPDDSEVEVVEAPSSGSKRKATEQPDNEVIVLTESAGDDDEVEVVSAPESGSPGKRKSDADEQDSGGSPEKKAKITE